MVMVREVVWIITLVALCGVFVFTLIVGVDNNRLQKKVKLYENESPTTQGLYFKYDKYTETCWSFYMPAGAGADSVTFANVPCTPKVPELAKNYPYEKD